MRSVCVFTLTAALLTPALLFAQSPADETGGFVRQVSALRGTGRPHRTHERHSRHGQPQPTANQTSVESTASAEVQPGPGIVEVPPPAPADDVPQPTPNTPRAVAAPPVPFVAPPFSLRDRLLAKRLGRVQQMKQAAAQSGDENRVQQAQYLEGMVLQLHEQGLFNFAQKFMSAMQQPETPAAAGPPAEIPEADLGAPSALPEIDLGEPEPPPANPPE